STAPPHLWDWTNEIVRPRTSPRGVRRGCGVRQPRQTERAPRGRHDPLTGLPDATLFLETLERAVDCPTPRAGRGPAVPVVHLDRFRVVNDALGNALGDRLLQEVAIRIAACVGTKATVARLAADEFAVLLTAIADDSDAARMAERIHEELRRGFD